MEQKTITLGHSPDPDDAFMHYALLEGRIDTDGYRFVQILEDIQSLNRRALRGELDITAVSVHACAYLAGSYAILPCGASMGEGYGPIVVSRRPLTRSDLMHGRIAVPGELTSAFLALQLWLERPAEELNYIVMPFDQILPAVAQNQVDAGLLIHEGQLTWATYGLHLCVDLGAWWTQTHGNLPLPLGVNVIHKRFEPVRRTRIARLLRHSIEYGLEHRSEALQYALRFGRGIDHVLGDRFVGMYVNRWTIDLGTEGRRSIETFLKEASQAGLIPTHPELEFVVFESKA